MELPKCWKSSRQNIPLAGPLTFHSEQSVSVTAPWDLVAASIHSLVTSGNSLSSSAILSTLYLGTYTMCAKQPMGPHSPLLFAPLHSHTLLSPLHCTSPLPHTKNSSYCLKTERALQSSLSRQWTSTHLLQVENASG